MKVRSIRGYVNSILGNGQTIPSEEKPARLLRVLQGEGTQLAPYLDQLSSFASNADLQVFYELIQNASDAGASEVIINWNEKYFIVINNGAPFYTDHTAPSGIERDGQLKYFLAKNKGVKYGKEYIGQYGQGSKLLYDLVIPESGDEKSSEKKKYLLKNQMVGPILFSWSRLQDLSRLIQWQEGQGISFEGAFNDDGLPLLTKIIYSFFPCELGEKMDSNKGDFFSYSELSSLASFLGFTIKDIHKSLFSKGSILFLPLGEGKSSSLDKNLIDSNLVQGLSTSLFTVPNLKRIRIKNIALTRPKRYSEELPLEADSSGGKTFRLLFPDDPNEIHESISNFFQYFPITNEVHGLNFIIDSKDFEITSSRQDLDLSKEHNKKVLEKIFYRIQEYLVRLKNQNDLGTLIPLIKCIISSKPEKCRKPLIREFFHEGLWQFLRNVLPAEEGFPGDVENLLIKRTKLQVPLQQLNENLRWLSPKLADYYDMIEERAKIASEDISTFLTPGIVEYFYDWLVNLSPDEYNTLLDEIELLKPDNLKKLKFIRFSNGKVYSISDCQDKEQKLFLLDSRLAPIKNILVKNKKAVGGEELFKRELFKKQLNFFSNDPQALFLRVIEDVEYSELIRDEKWTLLNTIIHYWEFKEEEIRDLFDLFKSKKGVFRALKELLPFPEKYSISGILSNFKLSRGEYNSDFDALFLRKEEIWGKVIEKWEQDIFPLLGEVDYQKLIQDFQNFYERAGGKDKLPKEYQWLLTRAYSFVEEDNIFFTKDLYSFSDQDFENFSTLIESVTSFNTLTKVVLGQVMDVEFAKLNNKPLNNLRDSLVEKETALTKEDLTLIRKAYPDGLFFEYFILKESPNNSDQFLLCLRNQQKQFFSTDQDLNDFFGPKDAFVPLPEQLITLFQTDESLLQVDEKLLCKWITLYGAEAAFLNAVLKSSREVQKAYCKKLSRIDLSSQGEITSYTERFEGRVLGLLDELVRDEFLSAEEAKEKVFIDGQNIREFIYDEDVSLTIKGAKPTTYHFSLSELIPEYKQTSLRLRRVREKLVGVSVENLFHTKPISTQSIIGTFQKNKTLINAEQLAFCVVVSHPNFAEKAAVPHNLLNSLNFPPVEAGALLESFFSHRLYFFEKHIIFPDFRLPEKIHSSDDNLLIEKEKIPDWGESWISNNPEKVSFLKDTGLQTEQGAIIKLRRKLLKSERVEVDLISSCLEYKQLVENTFQWFNEKVRENLSENLNARQALSNLLKGFVEKHKTLPDYFPIITNLEEEKLIIELKKKQQDKLYYFSSNRDPHDLNLILPKLKSNNGELLFSSRIKPDIQREAGIRSFRLEKSFVNQQVRDKSEWDAPFYKEWKEHEGKGYQVYLSPSPMPYNYELKVFSGTVSTETFALGVHMDQKAARQEEEEVVSLYLNKDSEDESVLALLGQNQKILFPEEGELEILVSLMARAEAKIPEKVRDVLTEIQQSGLSVQQVKERLQGKAGDYPFDRPMDKNEQSLLNKNLNPVLDLLKNIEGEELTTLLEKINDVKDFLKAIDNKSTPSKLIGYIGEILVSKWLKKRNPQMDVQWVGDQNLPYDIILNRGTHAYYLEVKTTIKPLKEVNEQVAFFVRKSQYEFIQNNPDKDYFVFRLSLKDINLKYLYERLKPKLPKGLTSELPESITSEIQNEIEIFLSEPGNMDLVEKRRMRFRMALPREEELPF